MAGEAENIRAGGDSVTVSASEAGIDQNKVETERFIQNMKAYMNQMSAEIAKASKPVTAAAATAGQQASAGYIDQINDMFGRSSTFGKAARIVAGTGPIYAVSRVGKELEHSTAEMVRLKNEMAAGTLSSYQMADQFVRTIPILGEMYGTFANIRELIDGDNAALQEANDHLARMNQYSDSLRKQDKERLATTKEWAKVLREAAFQEQLSHMSSSQRSAAEFQHRKDLELESFKDQLQRDAEKARQAIMLPALPAEAKYGAKEVTAYERANHLRADLAKQDEEVKRWQEIWDVSSRNFMNRITGKNVYNEAGEGLPAAKAKRSGIAQELSSVQALIDNYEDVGRQATNLPDKLKKSLDDTMMTVSETMKGVGGFNPFFTSQQGEGSLSGNVAAIRHTLDRMANHAATHAQPASWQ